MLRVRRPVPALSAEDRTDLKARFLTVSNLLSLSRVVLLVPFVLVMSDPTPGRRVWGASIILLAALTDNLDGLIARKLHQTSEWGKILDPVADKIAVGGVALTLFLNASLPLWFLAFVVGRDLLILAGAIVLRLRYGVTLASNELGKWTVGILALTLFTRVLWPPSSASDILLTVGASMMALSLVSYGSRGYRRIVGNR